MIDRNGNWMRMRMRMGMNVGENERSGSTRRIESAGWGWNGLEDRLRKGIRIKGKSHWRRH